MDGWFQRIYVHSVFSQEMLIMGFYTNRANGHIVSEHTYLFRLAEYLRFLHIPDRS